MTSNYNIKFDGIRFTHRVSMEEEEERKVWFELLIRTIHAAAAQHNTIISLP